MKSAKPSLTESELEIMHPIWEMEGATVREVVEALRRRKQIAYTTVMTLMNILVDKGHLTREKQGRAFRYVPTRPKTQVLSSMVNDFVKRAFGGSARPLVLGLVKDRKLSEEDLEEIRRMIREEEVKEENP